MKITIVAMEIPYPPMHGGRVDIWRRIEAFKQLGVEVQLLCWVPQEPDPEDIAVMKQCVSDLQLLDYVGKSSLSRLRQAAELLRYPLGITSRRVYGSVWRELLTEVAKFQPDVILVDGIHASVLARRLSRQLNIPFIVRSHNIEHQHRSALLKAAQGTQKLYSFLILLHLKRLEISVFRDCLAFFDISVDDLKYWQNLGLEHGSFLPPVADLSHWDKPASDKVPVSYDVVFLGNLNRENNVAGIQWFLMDIVPKLKLKKPNISILIAGSNPVKSIQELCEKIPEVTLTINPKSALDTYDTGRVLVNPIGVGGGVSIKSIDMLVLDKPIVSLTKGVYGLPDAVKSLFHMAEDADSFASAVIDCLDDEQPSDRSLLERHQLINEAFGLPRIEQFLEQLQEILPHESSGEKNVA